MAEVMSRLISVDEYYRAYPETVLPMELIEGEVVMSPAPMDRHQALVLSMARALAAFNDSHIQGRVVISPSDLHLDKHTVLQPDVFWIFPDNPRCYLLEGYWRGAPDLCIEILSPSTAIRDRTVKYRLYERFGVQEYWLIDPDARTLQAYVLREGAFVEVGTFHEEQTYTAQIAAELSIELARLFA